MPRRTNSARYFGSTGVGETGDTGVVRCADIERHRDPQGWRTSRQSSAGSTETSRKHFGPGHCPWGGFLLIIRSGLGKPRAPCPRICISHHTTSRLTSPIGIQASLTKVEQATRPRSNSVPMRCKCKVASTFCPHPSSELPLGDVG